MKGISHVQVPVKLTHLPVENTLVKIMRVINAIIAYCECGTENAGVQIGYSESYRGS